MTTTILIGALIAGAASQGLSYGESLLDSTHVRHPGLTAVQIEATEGQGGPVTITRAWDGRSRSRDRHTLSDANGNQIGTVTISTRCTSPTRSSAIVSEISRRIYSSASLSEPAPFVAGAVLAPSGQALIEDAINRDPQLVTLAFHVTPPLAQTNSIVASSFGRIGKLADADDERVMREGATLRELTNGGKRLAVELPLLDARGHTVGALSTSFRIDPNANLESIAKRAVALRDSLARKIPSLKALFRPATASRQVRGLHDCL